jgi:ATP-dependent DNA helicase RecG
LLTPSDIRRLLDAGPSARIEVLTPNTATSDRIARALASLANTRGGVLLIPLSERAKIGPDEARDRALQAMVSTEPRLIIPLPYLSTGVDGSTTLVCEVPEGLPNVYSIDGRYLGRETGRAAVIQPRALRALLLTRGENTWETTVPAGATKDNLSWDRIEQYASTVNQGDASVEQLLLRRGCALIKGRQLRPTHAGLLLFGKQPQRWVRGAETLCVRFKGEMMDDAFTRQTLEGTLPDQIKRAELFLDENAAVVARLKGWRRDEQPPYPGGVLREAVVNAIAHRDYRLSGAQIHVSMFASRVEVKSPGALPGHVTVKNLVRERYSRNEAIVQVLSDMGFIERLGYGVDRMLRAMKDAGQQPPRFEETEAGFQVTLYAREVTEADVLESLGSGAQADRIEKMLGHIKQHGRITNRDYQELCPDVSAESLRRDFVEVVERGVVMRVGDKRGTYYIAK